MTHRAENTDEFWDVYDLDRNRTGATRRRGAPQGPDEYRLVVHVCIFNPAGQLLIQQRQPWKKGWPGMWDLSVGGSAVAGDDSRSAAEREVYEELGLKLDLSGLRPRFTVNFTEGFDDYWIVTRDVALPELRLQEEEVQAVRWADPAELPALARDGTFIPYVFLDKLPLLREMEGSQLRDGRLAHFF